MKMMIGCFACMHNGGACIHDDDMRAVLAEIGSPMIPEEVYAQIVNSGV